MRRRTLISIALVAAAGLVAGCTRGDSSVVTTQPETPAVTMPPPTAVEPRAETVAPAGTGPEVTWTRVEPPPEGIRSLAWFKDAFYGLGFRPDDGLSMYRSSDGSVWQEVPSFVSALPDAIEVHGRVVADGDRLVVLGSEPSGWGNFRCPTPSGGLIVAVSSDGTTWTVSKITAEVPTPPSDAVCVSFFPGLAATGPAGVLVSASTSFGVDYEGIIADELGDNVAQNFTFLQHNGDRLVFSTSDGQNHNLSLSKLGYTQEDLALPPSGAIAWWSSDGVAWQQVARDGPMLSPSLGSITATDDGFFVTRGSIGLWKTTNGSSWETIDQAFSDTNLLDWAGTPVQFNSQRGELRFVGDTVLPVSDGFDAVEVVQLGLGGAGIIAVVSPSGNMETMEAMDAFWRSSGSALVYSPDGIVWRRWIPEEFDSFNKHEAVVAVGADTILVLTRNEAGSFAWIGVPET